MRDNRSGMARGAPAVELLPDGLAHSGGLQGLEDMVGEIQGGAGQVLPLGELSGEGMQSIRGAMSGQYHQCLGMLAERLIIAGQVAVQALRRTPESFFKRITGALE